MFLMVAGAQAGEPRDPTFERLAKVEVFAFGGIGYAGVISQGEKDYEAIFSRQSAAADFERLYATGNLQAKAYSLVGLRLLKPDKYRELSTLLRDSQTEVQTMHGCISGHEFARVVVEQIEAGRYPLPKRKPTASK